ncbi:tripartite tricarboxylate transporter TctB family protein [Rhizobium sp. P32RR-XVIII]|uniref:tripartite tricarboxylate transporter TctB family protein n=1 Tax=Rhizobium sp. P32RR-XVIII TaxID=2726738 RepID=UPI0014568EE1|nr:tripartite tricarboxylate transporter TctB family protein [Rhizobium sp. P32RR-XVIII]NLS07574.1 tripartite tricarboxylate transporter TctB family protein [Rhizobium sp. P32RR-XVIII]
MTRQYWKDGELIAGLTLAVLGGYVLLEASKWVIFNVEGPGPGFFPLGYGVLMLGLALALVFQRLTAEPPAAPAEPIDPGEKRGLIDAALTWIAIALSIPLMSALGFVVGFGLAVFFIVKVVFRRSFVTSFVMAAAIGGGLHFIFPVMLSAPLPVGKFWSF